ncbi:MAG: hypothetical protein GY699_07195 [Desulfobacteraceae bacterium]|nr:hypothetical protein [Desulfobacteraceae bacterium]
MFFNIFFFNPNIAQHRNPATGEEMVLDKRRVVTFKCAGKLRDRINGE